MAIHSTPLSRRSFSIWLTTSGLAVAGSRHVLAQDSAESIHAADWRSSEQTKLINGQPPLGAESFGQVSLERRSQDGRPPSEWLRSMDADELRAWLADVEVPEAGVSGMTFWTHLTRDHMFRPLLIKGLTEAEQAKLHAATHFGY